MVEDRDRIKVDVVIGTRPEAIKTAPVIEELRRRSVFSVRVVSTGQHTDMLMQSLAFFDIVPDIKLDIMRAGQTLDHITSSVLIGVGLVLDSDRPDVVLVHGDTSTALAAALAAFYRSIPVGHIEAGLRSGDMTRPFPEEMNRVVVDKIAAMHFAPTAAARDNLVREGVRADGVDVTGNTVIDALMSTIRKYRAPDAQVLERFRDGRDFILLTAHRRESWGDVLAGICRAARKVSERRDIDILIPMHKNPRVREIIESEFRSCSRAVLCEPLDYPDFVWALSKCRLIMSDSGGVQEEATALAKPLVILREVTERPEAVDEGSGVLAGTDEARVFEVTDCLLGDERAYQMLVERSRKAPFGDGTASKKIADKLERIHAEKI